MITILTDLPGTVLGAEASGQVTADDYQTILAPAIEAYLQAHDRVRLLVILGSQFEGFEGGALWEDARLGFDRISAWERIAVVTDLAHLRTMVGAFAFAIPGEVRTFALAELPDAREWVAA